MKCRNCGASIRARSTKCAKCGADVSASDNVPARNGGNAGGNSPATRAGSLATRASGGPRRLEAFLQVKSGPDKGAEFKITRILTMIGRQETCDIVLQEEVISREHGRIEQTAEGWLYRNLSDNGTWVNRKRVDQAVLSDGDTVELGARTRMKFVLREVEVAQVGPVFKRRARQKRQDEDQEETGSEVEVASPQKNSLEGAGKSLLKRKKVVMGLGVYLGLMLLVFVGIAVATSGGSDDTRKRPAVGQLKSREDIRSYMNFPFKYRRDTRMVAKKLNEAHGYYEVRATADPNALYMAVKTFSEAQAYAGGKLEDNYAFETFNKARKELVEQLWAYYHDAWVQTDVHHDYEKARDSYRKILQMLNDPVPMKNENEAYLKTPQDLYRHVENKMQALPR